MTESHELIKSMPQVCGICKDIWQRKCPAGAIPLTIEMQVRARNLAAIGVGMWRTTKINSRQDQCFARAILVADFAQDDGLTPDIKSERLSAVRRGQRNCLAHTVSWNLVKSVIEALFLHCQEQIGLGRGYSRSWAAPTIFP